MFKNTVHNGNDNSVIATLLTKEVRDARYCLKVGSGLMGTDIPRTLWNVMIHYRVH